MDAIMSQFEIPRVPRAKIRSLAMAHTLNGRAYRVCASALLSTRSAVVCALGRMRISGLTVDDIPEGERVRGSSGDRTVVVDVEKLNTSASRLRVTARIGSAYDVTTAIEVVARVVEILDGKQNSHSKGSTDETDTIA